MRASQKGVLGYKSLIITSEACSQSSPCHGELNSKSEDNKTCFAE